MKHKDLRKMPGWLAWQDYEIFRIIIEDQNTDAGALLEIGVHHGKSFVPMAAFSGSRKLYAIDIFGQQQHNIDHSGSGDKDAFLRNIAEHKISLERITIDERPSGEVTKEDVISAVGVVDFFHVDGAHHFSGVTSDLDLALSVVSEGGVVAIDDTFRPEWPEVSAAVFSHVAFQDQFVIFAIGFNKSYWCRKEHSKSYQALLLRNVDLVQCLAKRYQSSDRDVLVFQEYPLPEWRFGHRLMWQLSIYRPQRFVALSRFMRLPPVKKIRRWVRRISK